MSLLQFTDNYCVGAIEEVSAGTIKVLLDVEAPHAIALNSGSPIGFPRINGYILVPNAIGATVCLIVSVEIKRVSLPQRKGTQEDFDLLNLPFSSRIMKVIPLGTLQPQSSGVKTSYVLKRGVDVFPSVGDLVIVPNSEQISAIVGGETQTEGRIVIGYCPTPDRVPVYVDPDKIFGRHLAVLGNTGAGKSCSVAGLIRWSLDAVDRQKMLLGTTEDDSERKCFVPNSRFIILDTNGEYLQAFREYGVSVFSVEPSSNETALEVPAWLWNGEEWIAFTKASPGAQAPVLLEALRNLRAESNVSARESQPDNEIESIIDENTPLRFDIHELLERLDQLVLDKAPEQSLRQYVNTLKLRISGLLSNRILRSIIMSEDSDLTLEHWLARYVGWGENHTHGQRFPVSVIDLSLVPSEIIHIIVSVLARMIFEALQRYKFQYKEELPTVLVLDEAHNFVCREIAGTSSSPASQVCVNVFERIAREGRKFGLGLVLASQRPSELSPTVLSQCNTFLLHRLVNDHDQEIVKRMVPDGISSLLRELPGLPTQRAFLLGWGASIPTLVDILELPKVSRPSSPDPAYWDVWVGNRERNAGWSAIVRTWQNECSDDESHSSEFKSRNCIDESSEEHF